MRNATERAENARTDQGVNMLTIEEMDLDIEQTAEDLLSYIEHAEEILGRAERAIQMGDIQAGRDLMKEASSLLVD
jgi:hypothetical protein